jgi:senataxin
LHPCRPEVVGLLELGGGMSSSFSRNKRPSAAGRHRGNLSNALSYPGRFEEEVLSAGLFGDCYTSQLVDSLPLEFDSVDQYVSLFDPLVLEEAREGVRSGYTEQSQAGNVVQGKLIKMEEVGRPRVGTGAGQKPLRRHVRVTVQCEFSDMNDKLMRMFRKNSAAVIGLGDEKDGLLVPGLCLTSSLSVGITLKVYPTCPGHASSEEPPCSMWLSLIRKKGGLGFPVTLTPATALTTHEREFDALHSVKDIDSSLMKYILKPSLLDFMKQVYEDDKARRAMWPREASQRKFIEHLKSQYDYKQLQAIEMTACQLTARSKQSAFSTKLPFVLIQGPPGTGKTHTVCGVLNVWHLAAFQQYYSAMIRSVRETSMHSGSGLDSVEVARSFLGLSGMGSKKPRILVCTPSNAACDELMARVMQLGFRDGNGSIYMPNVVRIGGDAAVDGRVRNRFLDTLVSRYASMTEMQWRESHALTMAKLHEKKLHVRGLEMSLSKLATSEKEMDKMAHMLLSASQELEGLERQIGKLTAAWPLIAASGSQRNTPSGRQAVTELETLLLSDAEMVFSTLSSTQRRIFKDASVRAPFHTVLIDEAGQASEVAAIQAMTAGAKSIVLVGDPQQLPATIKSEAAKAVEMERSLFERLQIEGCPVALLSVQYRMHPEIRKFPSKHFYRDKLEDASAVTSLPPEPYHKVEFMGPYQVFDVASGREERSKSSSLSNSEEARVAACLFMKLERMYTPLNERQGTRRTLPSIAVITPYRQQKNIIRDTFKRLCGSSSLEKVAIETIDSYQGRQVDVVILSCVRAGASGGLGFVNDIRRMNVAITRARRSLWILGSLDTLKKNRQWQDLIQDATGRSVVVYSACVRSLLQEELRHLDDQKNKVSISSHMVVDRTVLNEADGCMDENGSKKPMKKASANDQPLALDSSKRMIKSKPMTRCAPVNIRAMKREAAETDGSQKPLKQMSRATHESESVAREADTVESAQRSTEMGSLTSPFDPELPSDRRKRRRRKGKLDRPATDIHQVSSKFPQLPDAAR